MSCKMVTWLDARFSNCCSSLSGAHHALKRSWPRLRCPWRSCSRLLPAPTPALHILLTLALHRRNVRARKRPWRAQHLTLHWPQRPALPLSRRLQLRLRPLGRLHPVLERPARERQRRLPSQCTIWLGRRQRLMLRPQLCSAPCYCRWPARRVRQAGAQFGAALGSGSALGIAWCACAAAVGAKRWAPCVGRQLEERVLGQGLEPAATAQRHGRRTLAPAAAMLTPASKQVGARCFYCTRIHWM